MAGIYLSKCEADFGRRDFHLGNRPLSEIAGRFGLTPADHEPAMPEHATLTAGSSSSFPCLKRKRKERHFRQAIIGQQSHRIGRCVIAASACPRFLGLRRTIDRVSQDD